MGLDGHALGIASGLQVVAVGCDQGEEGRPCAAQTRQLTSNDLALRGYDRLLDALSFEMEAALVLG